MACDSTYNYKVLRSFKTSRFIATAIHFLGKFCRIPKFINLAHQYLRLWSIHPKYLDSKGLIALWRESLLAQKVLSGKTKGYKNHPQLVRYKCCKSPISAIGYYLLQIYKEGRKRNYKFNKEKILSINKTHPKIKVTSGQVAYEFKYLKKKLKKRSPEKYKTLAKVKRIITNPLFRKVGGKTEDWEKSIFNLNFAG